MKICVVGCQNVGKSTVIKDFIEKYPEYVTPTESYRDVIVKHNLNINQHADIKGQTIILNKLIGEIITMDEENVIFDRSIIDNLVYSSWMYEFGGGGDIDMNYLQIAVKYGTQFIQHYDLIIHIPLMNDGTDPIIVNDNLRATDEDYRQQINDLFTMALTQCVKNFDYPSNQIIEVTGSREERLDQIRMIIDKYT